MEWHHNFIIFRSPAPPFMYSTEVFDKACEDEQFGEGQNLPHPLLQIHVPLIFTTGEIFLMTSFSFLPFTQDTAFNLLSNPFSASSLDLQYCQALGS